VETPMRFTSVCVLALLAVVLAPAPAEAGSGLYVPFPTEARKIRARKYFDKLNQDGRSRIAPLTERQLAQGAFVAGATPGQERAASIRAGQHGGSALDWPFQVLLVLAPIGAIAVARRS
jgi:hypothetical protein